MSNNNTLQERQILILRYGWDNNSCMTLEEVGCLFNITGTRARQIQNKAMRKIRRTLWGKNKAKEILLEKQLTFKINKVADNILFIDRYLNF
ncbi:sigma factor-like helix-turn-helix DNA-binding protein [Desnuesiella massiliensis]|uniref:sigma factor-like helix-turn-helix DNA-binding protein n=1 Tax=Desnuesiella massiliensis TaxID=1650662 RepID=UPI0006E3EAD8|nr:sigma factor-like helix-turn-helix DNA-binding protein [Desnuesiella massiliensis]